MALCVLILKTSRDTSTTKHLFIFKALPTTFKRLLMDLKQKLFLTHNFSTVNKELVKVQVIITALQYDRNFQPPGRATTSETHVYISTIFLYPLCSETLICKSNRGGSS